MNLLFPINRKRRPLCSAKSKGIAVYVCQIIPDTVVLVVLMLRTRWIWDFEGITPTGEKWSASSKRSSSVVLSARNFTWTCPVFNMGPRGDRPATYRLIHCTALAFALSTYCTRITVQVLYHKEYIPGPLERTTGECSLGKWNSNYRDDHKKHINAMSDKMQRSSKVKVGDV